MKTALILGWTIVLVLLLVWGEILYFVVGFVLTGAVAWWVDFIHKMKNVRCSDGHLIETQGVWECSSCHFSWEGPVWVCPFCKAETPYLQCEEPGCSLCVVSPFINPKQIERDGSFK